MNLIKKNLKIVIAFIVGIILASGITVYAFTVSASDVHYTLEDNKYNINNVDEALNKLYEQMNKAPSLTSGVSGTSANNTSYVSVSGFSKDSYYIGIVTTRRQGSLSISGVQTIFNQRYDGYMDGLQGAHLILIKATSTSATFTVSGTQGVAVSCYKIQ